MPVYQEVVSAHEGVFVGIKSTAQRPNSSVLTYIQNMLGCVDAGFEAIHAIALKAAIKGSILAVPEACFVMMIALPRGSTRALPTAHDINAWPPWHKVLSASFRSAVLIAPERDPSASFRSAVFTAPVSFQPCEMPNNSSIFAD
jgi:hypothetical protein